jgi:hypothetical protein
MKIFISSLLRSPKSGRPVVEPGSASNSGLDHNH